MIGYLTIATVRSASDLLADLTACRSLRHLGAVERDAVCGAAFEPKPPPAYREPKHTGEGFACSDCGKPRSDFSCTKCSACYQKKPKEFIWTAEAFSIAVSKFGYCCDVCESVTAVPEDRIEAAANRILDNMDGKTLPMLCKGCSQQFLAFCTREFGRDGRSIRSRDFEKINLAWVASQVRRAGQQVTLGYSAKDMRREPA